MRFSTSLEGILLLPSDVPLWDKPFLHRPSLSCSSLPDSAYRNFLRSLSWLQPILNESPYCHSTVPHSPEHVPQGGGCPLPGHIPGQSHLPLIPKLQNRPLSVAAPAHPWVSCLLFRPALCCSEFAGRWMGKRWINGLVNSICILLMIFSDVNLDSWLLNLDFKITASLFTDMFQTTSYHSPGQLTAPNCKQDA